MAGLSSRLKLFSLKSFLDISLAGLSSAIILFISDSFLDIFFRDPMYLTGNNESSDLKSMTFPSESI
jgi:hypothetical protein